MILVEILMWILEVSSTDLLHVPVSSKNQQSEGLATDHISPGAAMNLGVTLLPAIILSENENKPIHQ